MLQKTTTAFLCATLLVFPGCSSPGPAQNGTASNQVTEEQIAANPFTMDYEYSESQIKSMTENDTFETATEAGPFYAGNTTFEQPGLKKFQELKIAFVENVMKETDQLISDAQAYAADLKNLKTQYTGFLGETLELNKKLVKPFKELTKTIIEPEVRYTANFALYNSIDPSTTQNPATAALLKYQKTYIALENVQLLSQDTANTVSGLLTLQTALGNSTDDAMKTIGSSMDKDVPGMVDALGNKLATLQQQDEKIGTMLKQINTAEYLMGMASVEYMEQNLTALQPKIDGLTPKGDITADDVAFIKELAKQYKGFADEIQQQLANVDQKELLAYNDVPNTVVPLAYAEEEGYAQKAFGMFTSAAKSTYEAGKSVGSFTWNAAKSTFNAGKTIAGVTVDTIGANVKSGADIIYGVANGNSASEIADEIAGNFKKVGDNLKAGKSGSETMQTAKGYFEAAENAGGSAAETAVEKTIGKGWTSWMAGHVGKITVNMFTGLGKGITKVADTQATTGEIVEGTLDIGLSFIGGSKVIASGSQIAKGSKEALKLLGEKGINFLGKMITNADLKTLRGITAEILTNTKLTPAMVEKLISNSLNIEFKEGLKQELIGIGQKLNQEIIALIKKGGATVAENATTGAKIAFEDFVEKEFEGSLKGLGEAIVGVLGQDLTAYIDNVIANKAEDIVKGIIKNLVDTGTISGIPTAPELKDLAGKWSDGNMTVTDVTMSDDFKKEAEKEGCDLSQIEAQKGKKQPMQISLSPTSETGGNMIVKIADGEAQTIPFTYSDGVITGTFSQQDATMNINMKVTEEGGSLKTDGNMSIDYKNGGLKVTGSAGASKALPPPTPAAPAPAGTGTNPPPAQNEIQSFANT